MASEMGCKAALVALLFLIGAAAANVELTGVWKPGSGWEMSCSWRTMINDSLQSVKLFKNGGQYVDFRPEVNGLKLYFVEASDEFRMKIDCVIWTPAGQRGRCLTAVELLARPKTIGTDLYRCEVSGESPTFRQEAKEYEALVPPSSATVTHTLTSESTMKTLNCSASGIPPPKLVWSVRGRPIPEDFTYTDWNNDSKLWNSWSTLAQHFADVTCTPEVVARDRQLVTGTPFTVNAAIAVNNYDLTKVTSTCLALLLTLLK